MARAARVRVIVVDDHPLYREGVATAIKDRPELELVGECATGAEALECLADIAPDVAVLELRLRDMTAIDVLRTLDGSLATRILVLSAFTEPSMVYDVVAAGVAGYMTKGCTRAELCDAIIAVAHGRRTFSHELQDLLIEEIPRHNGNDWQDLSPRELQILRLVADGHSARTMAQLLNLGEATIKTHLKHLYEKLGVSERAAAVAAAMRRGLLQ
jgi:two-component system, NarL family, nitrate/nitrite response regulator NarL